MVRDNLINVSNNSIVFLQNENIMGNLECSPTLKCCEIIVELKHKSIKKRLPGHTQYFAKYISQLFF